MRETAYCQYLLEKHPMMCLKQKLFDQNGDCLLYTSLYGVNVKHTVVVAQGGEDALADVYKRQSESNSAVCAVI